MNLRTITTAVVVAAGALLQTVPVAADPIDVIREADSQMMGDRFYSNSKITAYKGTLSTMAATFETRAMRIGGNLRTLSVYVAPPLLKGTAYLVTEDGVWTRFGLTGRVREMGRDALADANDGTDFGYYDLGETSGGLAELYHARMVDDRVRAEGVACTKIGLTPRDSDLLPYERLVAFVALDEPRYIRIDYYRNGVRTKHLVFGEYRRVGSGQYPFSYVMHSDTGPTRTEVKTLEVEFASKRVTPDMFTVEYLKSL